MQTQLGLAAMMLMGIQLSLLMVAAFFLLCLGVLYHLYSGFLLALCLLRSGWPWYSGWQQQKPNETTQAASGLGGGSNPQWC